VAKVTANITVHMSSSIAWQAGARAVSQPPAPGSSPCRWMGPRPVIRGTCTHFTRIDSEIGAVRGHGNAGCDALPMSLVPC
jgi:hypothetical protein